MLKLAELVDRVRAYHPAADVEIVSRAYDFSVRAHEGQKRKSGDPYFIHPASVAGIITELTPRHRQRLRRAPARRRRGHARDAPTTSSASSATRSPSSSTASPSSARSTSPRKEDRQAENFRKMVVAMARDIRVLLVKLCDRARQHADARAHEARGAGAHRARDAGDLRAAREPPRHRSASRASSRTSRSSTSSPRRTPTSTTKIQQDASASATSTSPTSRKTLSSAPRRAGLRRRRHRAREAPLLDLAQDEGAASATSSRSTTSSRSASSSSRVADCYAALGVIHSQWTPVPGPLQGLRRAAEAEHVPVAPHDGHRPGARAHRDPDPHPRDAPRRRARHRRALEVQGAHRRRRRSRRTPSASAGCAS